MNLNSLKKFCRIAGLVLTLAGSVAAQTAGGTILGRMEDPSGAVIPAGHVVIKNQATGVTRELTTNAAGLYLVPDLAPGKYAVSGDAQGFGGTVINDVVLDVGGQVTVNLRMQVGAVGQNVVVEANAANVELSSSEMTAVVETQAITELPLNGRDWTQLAQLQPGIAEVRSQNTTDTNRAATSGWEAGVDLSISGKASANKIGHRLNGVVGSTTTRTPLQGAPWVAILEWTPFRNSPWRAARRAQSTGK